MWILAIDVRDGQRLAFPQLTTAISFDVAKHKSWLEAETKRLEFTKDAALAKHRAEIVLGTVTGRENSIERREYEERIEAIMASAMDQADEQFKAFKRRAAKESSLEALLYFNGAAYPVRAVRLVTSWDDVAHFTGREPERFSTDDKDMPKFDDKPKPGG
jgi:hypothetical protein